MPINDTIITALERNWAMIDAAVEGLDDEMLSRIPAEQCNSIAWLIWHLDRVMDTFRSHRVARPGPGMGHGRLGPQIRHGRRRQ